MSKVANILGGAILGVVGAWVAFAFNYSDAITNWDQLGGLTQYILASKLENYSGLGLLVGVIIGAVSSTETKVKGE